jgi:exopolysaccharide biosynthesis WecB/TagA/CpsF family protein
MHAVLARVRPMACDAAVAALIADLAAAERVMVVSFVNQHGLNLCWSRPGFAGLLAGADVLLRDGVGVELCLGALGRAPGVNMVGTDFIPRLVRAFTGRRVALYGTAEPWLGRAAAALRAEGCRLVSVLDGFAPAARYAGDVAAFGPELVVLAMGMGKQEEVARAIALGCAGPVVVVNGGAIADYWGGRFARAPRWMLAWRLEWLFRLVQEPRRLWRRYVTGGIAFLWRALVLVLAVRRGGLPELR